MSRTFYILLGILAILCGISLLVQIPEILALAHLYFCNDLYFKFTVPGRFQSESLAVETAATQTKSAFAD